MSRNMKYLNDNRIIYRKYSEDQPTQEYKWGWYYADGTHGYYSLFNSPAKITTIRSLKWHLLVLYYLNPDIKQKKFEELAAFLADKENGFITFNIIFMYGYATKDCMFYYNCTNIFWKGFRNCQS